MSSNIPDTNFQTEEPLESKEKDACSCCEELGAGCGWCACCCALLPFLGCLACCESCKKKIDSQ